MKWDLDDENDWVYRDGERVCGWTVKMPKHYATGHVGRCRIERFADLAAAKEWVVLTHVQWRLDQ